MQVKGCHEITRGYFAECINVDPFGDDERLMMYIENVGSFYVKRSDTPCSRCSQYCQGRHECCHRRKTLKPKQEAEKIVVACWVVRSRMRNSFNRIPLPLRLILELWNFCHLPLSSLLGSHWWANYEPGQNASGGQAIVREILRIKQENSVEQGNKNCLVKTCLMKWKVLTTDKYSVQMRSMDVQHVL